jgi:hypothetical protein
VPRRAAARVSRPASKTPAAPRTSTSASPTTATATADLAEANGANSWADRDIHVIAAPFGAACTPPPRARANTPRVSASPPCARAISPSSDIATSHPQRDSERCETERTATTYYGNDRGLRGQNTVSGSRRLSSSESFSSRAQRIGRSDVSLRRGLPVPGRAHQERAAGHRAHVRKTAHATAGTCVAPERSWFAVSKGLLQLPSDVLPQLTRRASRLSCADKDPHPSQAHLCGLERAPPQLRRRA